MKTFPFPVRLHEGDRPALLAHFLALESEDRRLRFGGSLGDFAIASYVERIDFDNDGIFAIQDNALAIVAAVHVARAGEGAELGLSVQAGSRGLGLGSALFERAAMHVRNQGVRSVFVHCLSENSTMMHIARQHGMRMVVEGPETDAHLELLPSTPHTHYLEWLQDQQSGMLQAVRRQGQWSRLLFGLKPAAKAG